MTPDELSAYKDLNVGDRVEKVIDGVRGTVVRKEPLLAGDGTAPPLPVIGWDAGYGERLFPGDVPRRVRRLNLLDVLAEVVGQGGQLKERPTQ